MDLEELLTAEAGFDPAAVAQVRQSASRAAIPLVAALVDGGLVPEDTLAELLAAEIGTIVLDVEHGDFEREAVAKLPASTARRYLVLPVAADADANSLRVAFADPTDGRAVEVVRDLTGLGIVPLVATVTGIRGAIERLYGPRRGRKSSAAPGEIPAEVTRRMDVPDLSSVAPPDAGTAPMHRIEHEATAEQRHEALLLALVEAGALTRADYLKTLRRLLGRDR